MILNLDIIGDIHGCYEELIELIQKLDYSFTSGLPIHPEGRMLAFVGDATDRGPSSLQTLQLLFKMQDANILHYCPGNHCNKLYRYTLGNRVQISHGLETTVAEIDQLSKEKRHRFVQQYRRFYDSLPLFQTFDDGQLIIAHAGIREQMIFSPISSKTKAFVLYGETTGETLPNGRPVRLDWASSYKGSSLIVYGHTPVVDARFFNNTVNIDTGCVFGGKLTALRYPEMEIVSVPSTMPYQPDRFTHY